MSTDYQKYSTANQAETIGLYAAAHQMLIVRTYADEGKSGLRLDNRPALKRLIDDIQGGDIDFQVVLVYDVSRWGRFQDTDESAHYEYVCKRAGIAVRYCAEQFENDGSLLSGIVKGIKRAMAAEYSRDLSVKTFAGQSRIVKLGFRPGAQAGYALRRLLVDQNGTPKFVLARGERKALQTDRIVLIPGPPEEVTVVRWIYGAFVRRRKSEGEIAALLNSKGTTTDLGRPWTRYTVRYVLQSEKYVGNNVWNRNSFKLRRVRVRNGPELWLRADGAFQPIIDQSLFRAAQAIFVRRESRTDRRRPHFLSDRELLQNLRELLREHGDLSWKIIQKNKTGPCVRTYRERFGSLEQAFALIGYAHARTRPVRARKYSDEQMLDALRRLLRDHGDLSRPIIDGSKGVASSSTYGARFGSMDQAYQLIGFTPKRARGRPTLRGMSNAQMLDLLIRLWRERGRLSRSIIEESKSVPSHYAYHMRFGGLIGAYRLIGYLPQDRRQRRQ